MSDIREFIENYIRINHLSLTAFAQKLGYKSKTTIIRIMDAESSAEAVYRLASAMECKLDLPSAERDKLREVVKMTVLGSRTYYAEKAMWRFMRNEGTSVDAPLLYDVDTGFTQQITERYSGKKDLHCTLINCTDAPLFGALNTLLKNGANITHYIYVDSDTERTIKMVNALMLVLYEKNYMCFALDETKRQSVLSMGIAHADAMLCQYTDENAKACEDVIVFSAPDHGQLVCRRDSKDTFFRWLGVFPERYQQFKHVFRECINFQDYQEYSADYAALEANRSIWKVKPDVGIDYVPIDILETATWEGPMRGDSELPLFVEALRPIYAKRFHNAMTKRKPVYTIFKKNAMQNLALTGKASDHFWGMRPYTPTERIRIFEHLLKQNRVNPYFNLFFFENDDLIRDAEIACFEGAGVLMLNHETDYDLANSHAQVLITQPEFMRLYQHFFMNTLLKSCVLSSAETETFFAELIHICQHI